jgi:hypothetical protein
MPEHRTEEIDMLFASKSPFVWDEEAMFAKLKAERPQLEHVRRRPGTAGLSAGSPRVVREDDVGKMDAEV